MVKDDSESECDTAYQAIKKERELAIKRGDTSSVIDASHNRTCKMNDNLLDPDELTTLLPHNSRKLNVDNYLMHLQ